MSAEKLNNTNTNKTTFEQLVKDAFKGKDPNFKALFKETFASYSQGVYSGYRKTLKNVKYSSLDFRMLNELTYNVGVFAAFRNHQQNANLVALLKKQDGSLRNFKEFENEANKLLTTYNQRYLKVEYNQAVTSARAARAWQDIERTKHLYPNLMYIAIQDDRTRAKHRQWHGIILPVEHPFWDSHYPPNDWECRCKVRRTDKPENTKGYNVESPSKLPKQFHTNVGKSGKVFTDKHPYFNTPNHKEVARFANNALVHYGRQQVLQYFKENGLPKTAIKSQIGKVSISKKALNHLVSTYHEHAYMRNNLLYDIKNVINDALYIKSAKSSKNNPMVKKYHYLMVNVGKIPFYLNVREMVNGDMVLYAITGKLK